MNDSNNSKRITLVLGPGQKTKGGIASVIKAQSETGTWEKWNCIWVETFTDRSFILKIIRFLTGFIKFLTLLPNTQIVHIHFSEPTSALRKYLFLLTAKALNKKVVLHFHAFSPNTTLFGPKKDFYKKMLTNADKIIVLSQFWKQQIEKVIKDDIKTVIVYNPCPNISINNHIKKKKVIVYAGILNKRKGYMDLLQAFAAIASDNPDWKVVFAGNGEIENGIEYARSNNILNQVIFTGWITGKDKDELFRTASVFCLPSYAEGFPMAIVEAWAYGLPVITTPVGGLPDILDNNINALVFQPGDKSTLANHLELLIKNENLRNALSKESVKLSQGLFNLSTFDKELDKIYSGLLNEIK